MKGSEIIGKLGVTQTHCFVEREMITIDPEAEYPVVRGTENHPRIVCGHHEAMIKSGKYPRLKIDGSDVVADIEWTTGHHPFENDIDPKHSDSRPKIYTVQ